MYQENQREQRGNLNYQNGAVNFDTFGPHEPKGKENAKNSWAKQQQKQSNQSDYSREVLFYLAH